MWSYRLPKFEAIRGVTPERLPLSDALWICLVVTNNPIRYVLFHSHHTSYFSLYVLFDNWFNFIHNTYEYLLMKSGCFTDNENDNKMQYDDQICNNDDTFDDIDDDFSAEVETDDSDESDYSDSYSNNNNTLNIDHNNNNNNHNHKNNEFDESENKIADEKFLKDVIFIGVCILLLILFGDIYMSFVIFILFVYCIIEKYFIRAQ